MKIEMWPVDKPVPYAQNADNISNQAFGEVPARMTAAPFYLSRAILSPCFDVRVLPDDFFSAGGTTAPFR